jgi:pyrroline-5-carboxylate reductase
MNKVGFIGVGNMGYAIIKGVSGNAENTEIYAYDKDAEKIKRVEELGAYSCTSEQNIVEKCKYVVLAVKRRGLKRCLIVAPVVMDSVLFLLLRE